MRLISLASVSLAISVVAGAAVYLGLMRANRCDSPGSPCCPADALVATDHCHQGLGCNLASGRCEACGAPEQVCCDGDFTGFSGKGYSGALLDPLERVESCDPGASCDAQPTAGGTAFTGSRRCLACGTRKGGSCCPPDVRFGLGRCFADAGIARRLTCDNPWLGAEGHCIPCGTHLEPSCASSFPCDDGLVAENGICVVCGRPGTPTCDRGEPCRGADSVVRLPDGAACVLPGSRNQRCLPNGTCATPDLYCTADKVCKPCGGTDQTCCPPGPVAGCRNGVCYQGRCTGPISGGSSSVPPQGDYRTCSNQPRAVTALPLEVFIEMADGCVLGAVFLANDAEEALRCARAAHGDAVLGFNLGGYHVAYICPSGCLGQTLAARDQDAAESCIQAQFQYCTVVGTSCP